MCNNQTKLAGHILFGDGLWLVIQSGGIRTRMIGGLVKGSLIERGHEPGTVWARNGHRIFSENL